MSDCSLISPLVQRYPVFGQQSPSEAAVKVPSWLRVWKIRYHLLQSHVGLQDTHLEFVMSRAHLQQIPLHETPVGPTAQLMTTNVLVPSSLILPIKEASFPSCWVGFVNWCVGWSGWGTVFLPGLHLHMVSRMEFASISAGVCNYHLSLSPGSVLLLKLFRVHRWQEKTTALCFIP